jgi:hypothetical protein
MAKGAFGQKQGGALAIAWPKEEGSDFAGHRMAIKSDPLTGHPLVKKPPRSAFGHK